MGIVFCSAFSLGTARVEDAGLKIAVVYLHRKSSFEVRLSARNRDMAWRYKAVIRSTQFDGYRYFMMKRIPMP